MVSLSFTCRQVLMQMLTFTFIFEAESIKCLIINIDLWVGGYMQNKWV